MEKRGHINPILSNKSKRKTDQQPRKIRSDKLHDIKVPVTESIDLIIRREARKGWGGSKTSVGTEILLYGLDHIFEYPEVIYKDGPFTVHCKVDHTTYNKIGLYADKWKCSIRMAAHRIFIEALKKKQLGGINHEEI
ncbi:hypothetical protein [Niallia sp. Krafla_26]|uniref:hypothetical protein n=1 Tax=Niallia sp. Krafla_26 TaxID=3064703 RepID=UPI003D179D0C